MKTAVSIFALVAAGVVLTPQLAVAQVAKAAVAAAAATSAGDGKVVVEELVVTAEKHQEQLENAPIAVTVFTADQRNLIAANTTRQMVDLTPGVYLTDTGINMRGVGRQNATTALGSENGIAYYVNGFYNFDFNVIGESTLYGGYVQFLRGPQGTLYGRDAIGGASNLISRRPTKEFRGEAVAAYGRFQTSNLGLTVSGPMTDRYRIRLAWQHFNSDGSSQKNRAPTKAGLSAENNYMEFQLEGEPTDNLHFNLRSTAFQYMSDPSYTAPRRYNNTICGTPVPAGCVNAPFMGALVVNPQYYLAGAPPTKDRVIDIDTKGADRLTGNQVHILNADYNLGKATLYYVGGYATYKAKGYSDLDNTSRASYIAGPGAGQVPGTGLAPGTLVSTNQVATYNNRNHYFSHELRLSGNDTKALEWSVGLYYLNTFFNESYYQSQPNAPALDNPILSFTTFAAATPNPNRAYYSQQNVLKQASTAAFGQATWHLDDVWSITGGLRYTDDVKHASTRFRYVFYNPAFGRALNVTPSPVGDYIADPSFAGLRLKIHDHGVTGRLGVEYKPSDQTLAYASFARGYKAGGFTLGDAVANNITKPEHLNAYEVGIKQDFSAELQADATVFYYDYRNMQIPITALNATTGGTFAQYTNFPKARMYGLELQATWQPVEALWLNANYTYLNAQTREFCCAVDFTRTPTLGQNLKGRDLPRSPHNKAALAGTYTWRFQPGSLILGGSVAYNGSFYSNAFQNPIFKVPGYTVANISATWRSDDNRYELVGQVTNFTDKTYATSVGVAGSNLGFAQTRFLGAPLQWNALLRYRF